MRYRIAERMRVAMLRIGFGNRRQSTVVWALLGVYSLLAFTASGCFFLHGTEHHAESHHSEPADHSSLCAWACQATSDAWPATESPALSTGPVVRLVVSSLNQVIPSLSSSLLHSRAPPPVLFILIG
jgi:hypothetical protein